MVRWYSMYIPDVFHIRWMVIAQRKPNIERIWLERANAQYHGVLHTLAAASALHFAKVVKPIRLEYAANIVHVCMRLWCAGIRLDAVMGVSVFNYWTFVIVIILKVCYYGEFSLVYILVYNLYTIIQMCTIVNIIIHDRHIE